jgi:hypothetical protein
MAKKQSFGEKVLAAKLAQRKMAKVIISHKTDKSVCKFKEAVIDADKVQEFISDNKI